MRRYYVLYLLGFGAGFTLAFGASACRSTDTGTVTNASGPTELDRYNAADQTARTHASCSAIHPFYWEIGDATGTVGGGSTGDGSVTATTSLLLASASKWVFGAYVAEKRAGTLTAADLKALEMGTGYTSFGTCAATAGTTVQACFTAGGNDTYTAADDGKFAYGGGHFQKWGVDHGLASMNRAQLDAEYVAELGSDFTLTFVSPQLAGGLQGRAIEYALFLQKILAQTYKLHALLGTSAVCTQPSSCATATTSPIPGEAWHYSVGHWIEDDAAVGDGAFSSPGLFGFYPWIDSAKKYYGLVARYDAGAGAYLASIQCGRLIRKAFATAQAQ